MKRSTLAILSIGLGFSTVIAAGAAEGWRPQRSQKIVLDPTRFHDELFNTGRKGEIDRWLAQSTGDIEIPTLPPHRDFVTIEADLAMDSLICDSNTVLIGTLQSFQVRLSADGGAVYTNWRMRNADTLKSSALQSTPYGSVVEVLAIGGTLERAGRKVTVPNGRLRGFVPARRYLLFLRLVPETGAFRFLHGFDITETRVERLSEDPLYLNLEALDRGDMLALLQTTLPSVLGHPNCRHDN